MRAEDHLPLGAPERLKAAPAAPKPPCKHQWLAMPDSKTHSRCADCGTVTLTEMVAPKPPPAPVPSAQCQEEDDDALGVCIKPQGRPLLDFERLMVEANIKVMHTVANPPVVFDPGRVGEPFTPTSEWVRSFKQRAARKQASPEDVALYTEWNARMVAAKYAPKLKLTTKLEPGTKLFFKPAPKPFPETTPYTFTPRGYLNPKDGRAPADTRVDLYFMDGSTAEDFNSNFVNWSPDLGPRTVIGWRRTTVWQKHDGSTTRPAGVGYGESVRVRMGDAEFTVPASCFWRAGIAEWRRLAP
jgi:hypothetical protein